MAAREFALKGRINQDGKGITFHHPDTISHFVKESAGVDVDLTIIFGKVKRSLAQNRYLWGVAYPYIAKCLREKNGVSVTSELLHTHNLQVIQGVHPEVMSIAGSDIVVLKEPKSSKMTVEEFQKMVEDLKDWYAINHEIVIPDPEGDNTITEFLYL